MQLCVCVSMHVRKMQTYTLLVSHIIWTFLYDESLKD